VPGQLAKLLVDQREKLLGGVGIAELDSLQHQRDFTHAAHCTPGKQGGDSGRHCRRADRSRVDGCPLELSSCNLIFSDRRRDTTTATDLGRP
jgi:hypothetical protein